MNSLRTLVFGFVIVAVFFQCEAQAQLRSPVRIAIIDSGINPRLGVFKNRLPPEFSHKEMGACSDTQNIEDDQGHGTAVAGIIAEMNRTAQILPIRYNGKSENSTEGKVICAINLAVRLKANIINVSAGGSRTTDALKAAFQRANDAGILIVAAAGNHTENRDTHPLYPASYQLSNLISVTATDGQGKFLNVFNDSWENGSSYGPKTIDVGAYGDRVQIYALDGTRMRQSGTSFSAAYVSAIAGAVWSRNPGLSAQALKSYLMSKTVPITGSGIFSSGPFVKYGNLDPKNF